MRGLKEADVVVAVELYVERETAVERLGNPSAEYYNSSFFIAVPLWFLEFAILSPHEGPDAPTYVGNARCDGTVSGESSDVIRPARRKVLHVYSLMVP